MDAHRRKWVYAAIAIGVVAVAVAIALAPGPLYERRGTVAVPYESRDVHDVRLLGAVTVYVDGKFYGTGEPRINANLVGSIALLMLATGVLVAAAALRIARARRRLVTFYLVAAGALAFAGLDKLLAIHESTGHNLRFLADVPGVERPDDLILALYLIPALAGAYWFRDVIADDRRAASALALALGFFALSAFADLASAGVEKPLELVSGLFIAAGLVKLVHHHLRESLDPGVDVIFARRGEGRRVLGPLRAR